MNPEYDAIHFLDGWTGRALYLGQILVCTHRHPTEAEAVACISGPDAETPPLAPNPPVGTSGPTLPAPGHPGRQSRRPAPPAPRPPPRTGHPATCKHRWCYCYDSAHPKTPGPCIICRAQEFNNRRRDERT